MFDALISALNSLWVALMRLLGRSSSVNEALLSTSGSTAKKGVALIVIDVQNDFCPGGALAVADGDKVVPVCNKLRKARKWNAVVLTQDHHPRGHCSFASNNPGHPAFTQRKLTEPVETEQMMWPDHCVQGTRGAEFHPALVREQTDLLIRKGQDRRVDSYSGFGDAFNGRFEKTELADKLRELGVEHVVLCGLATDYCVAFTALDARKHGFECTVVLDGCRGIDPKTINEALERMKEEKVIIVRSVEEARRVGS